MRKKLLFLLLSIFVFSCSKNISKTADVSSSKPTVSKDYAEPPHIDLINARWVLIVLNGVEAKSISQTGDLYIRFKDSTSVEGFAGCNKIFGSYTSKGNTIKIGPLSSTRMSCPDDALEMKFNQALESAETYTTDSKYLYLNSKGKVIAKLEALYL